jgi:hypothetical protein
MLLQVRFSTSTEQWELTEDEFLDRIDAWVAEDFASASGGSVSVQGVDELDRVAWLAYYPNARALVGLAREIREGRGAMRSQARKNGHV